jgi:subtilase family serine protease
MRTTVTRQGLVVIAAAAVMAAFLLPSADAAGRVIAPADSATTGRAAAPATRAWMAGGHVLGAVARVASMTAASQAGGLPPRGTQIKVLTAVLKRMAKFPQGTPGSADVIDYGIGALWRKGVDGAGTTIAVIAGWDDKRIAQKIAGFDKAWGLPAPEISTIFPAGRLPAACPPGMNRLGDYGSCSAWEGELTLDVMAAHVIAPYARILIAATPADMHVTEDAASQVAPPEMMEALEHIASGHLANVISISDETGEAGYRRGRPEITAQDPGELSAAAAGIPVLVATGDCGIAQNLPVATSQCSRLYPQPDTGAWDDSPWVTAVGGSIPSPFLNPHGRRIGPGPLSQGSAAGYSAVFARPAYQDNVARITGSPMRSVPDITMDGLDGTSEAAPLLAGVLVLATQVNHGNVGPINPLLYRVLGPRGAKAGIADVISGSDPAPPSPSGQIMPGFTAARGFDVASGWGTINGNFVPALVAATRAAQQDAAVRE